MKKRINNKILEDKSKDLIGNFEVKMPPVDLPTEKIPTKELTTEEEKKEIMKKYHSILSDPNAISKEIEDKISKFEIPTLSDYDDEIELTEEDIDGIILKINTHFSEINSEFKKLVKEDEDEDVKPPLPTKKLKPKNIKIPRLTYKQIKAHCKEKNVEIEDWLEKIALNEINRIIIRLGDINYTNVKRKKKSKI
jgi:hypothetical protein